MVVFCKPLRAAAARQRVSRSVDGISYLTVADKSLDLVSACCCQDGFAGLFDRLRLRCPTLWIRCELLPIVAKSRLRSAAGGDLSVVV